VFGSTIIDVAVGLIFFYFLFSMITSHINEFIASTMQWRAKDLENQIRRMLGDPDLANKVLNHPMITSITSRSGKPSYIPPNTFALALFDAFVPAGQTATALEHVRAGIANQFPSSQGAAAVLKILDTANGDMQKARLGAEEWFNASMDRLSGAYKRRMQWLTLAVSFVITMLLGADSLAIANALYQEPALRAAVTGAAQAAPASASVQATQNQPGSVSSLQQSYDLLSKSSLPIGWGTLPTDAVGWFKKVLGLLITTLAISLGAPFWFDLLKNLANLRSSGPSPASLPAAAPVPASVSVEPTVPVVPTPAAVASAASAPPAPAAPPAQVNYPGGI
jgi:hypothetical protein